MKKVIFLLFIIFIIAGLFVYYARKNSFHEEIGFHRTPIQTSTIDTLSAADKNHDAMDQAFNLRAYNITLEDDKALNYLLPSKPPDSQVVKHLGYTLAYDERNEEADWVAYVLTAAEVSGYQQRSNNFMPDPLIVTGSAIPGDYLHSGYDRGHLAPAADMRWSQKAMQESFYMSNMTPQVPGFNRGIWKDLEEQVRKWTLSEGTLFIVTGPVFERESNQREYIGNEKVAVPDAFYKIILDYRQPDFKVISFCIPNKEEKASFRKYTVSIDDIEKKTGLNFFAQLPDSMEINLEKVEHLQAWHD